MRQNSVTGVCYTVRAVYPWDTVRWLGGLFTNTEQCNIAEHNVHRIADSRTQTLYTDKNVYTYKRPCFFNFYPYLTLSEMSPNHPDN